MPSVTKPESTPADKNPCQFSFAEQAEFSASCIRIAALLLARETRAPQTNFQFRSKYKVKS